MNNSTIISFLLAILSTAFAGFSEKDFESGDAYGFGHGAQSSVEHKYDYEPSKVIEQTKPYNIPVVKKVGVPQPHPVHFPIPQVVKVGVPSPYAVHVNVPHPVEIPIYKLVPQEIEKKVPVHVNKLVPVYIKKPYKVILEKHYPVYVNKPYPVHVPIFKHVYVKKAHKSHSGFEDHHEHH